MFNRNIDDVEEIKKMFPDAGYIQWTPRYSKKLIQNPYCSFSGNRLLFIEPLHALALYYYIDFAERICQYLESRNDFNLATTNYNYHHEVWTYQAALAYHYNYGSVFDSKFWNKTQEAASSFMSKINNGNEEIFKTNLVNDIRLQNHEPNYSKIGTFTHKDHIQLYCGMKDISPQQLFMEMN